MLWECVVIGEFERLLLIRNGQFERILVPGEYRIGVTPFDSIEVERHDTRALTFRSAWAEYLLTERPDVAERFFTSVETGETEVAMVYVNGELFRLLAPFKRVLFWRGVANIVAEVVSVIADTASVLEANAGW